LEIGFIKRYTKMKVETPHIEKISFNVEKIRNDFPILKELIHGKPLCYLDNAATTQKPQVVIDSLVKYYSTINSNIHRGVHYLSGTATDAYENARAKVRKFINATSEKEIVFTRGTTESINLVANSFGRNNLNEGDEIIISGMEHHSNIVPWQLITAEKKATIKIIPFTDEGELILDEFEKLISESTKIVSVVYVSNSLGTVNPVKQIIETAHKYDIPVLIDAAQAVNHLPVDVQELDCDFLAFSGHKIYGPTGIGVLYGKENLLDRMPPYMGGGDMISKVTFEKSTYNELPFKFEAGTSNIAGAVGLGTALDYVSNVGLETISKHENELLDYATQSLSQVEGLKIIGNAGKKSAVISFVFDNIHPHDIGTFLDFEGVAVRTGHHCTQPVMDRYNIPATTRASLAMYNTKDEIDVLVNGLKKITEVFK
jgi:cysteine desulfurase/selenocysteine lyase